MGLATLALWAQPISPSPAAGAAGSARIAVYAASDESAPTIATLTTDEKATPIAEMQSAGGITWYLIKTKNGVVGWIKRKDDEQSKTVESFFRSLPKEAAGIAVDRQRSSTSSARRDAVVIPVTMNGRSVIVPVTFNGTVNANLLLDTGASMTMISRRLATALALPLTEARLFLGIGGTVSAPIARVESVKVGDAEVSGMAVSIHDVPRSQFEGLLGMDFLGRFQVSVDSAKKLLVLSPK